MRTPYSRSKGQPLSAAAAGRTGKGKPGISGRARSWTGYSIVTISIKGLQRLDKKPTDLGRKHLRAALEIPNRGRKTSAGAAVRGNVAVVPGGR